MTSVWGTPGAGVAIVSLAYRDTLEDHILMFDGHDVFNYLLLVFFRTRL